MSSTAAVAAHGAHAEHHQLSFMRTYIFSEDHKMIGRQFLFMALFMMSIGGLMAMLMRWELGCPETAATGLHWVPEPYMYDGAIPPNTYNGMFTMHATIMIFFVVMPILVGCFCNFLIPRMLGAVDVVIVHHRGPRAGGPAGAARGARAAAVRSDGRSAFLSARGRRRAAAL